MFGKKDNLKNKEPIKGTVRLRLFKKNKGASTSTTPQSFLIKKRVYNGKSHR